MVLACFIVICKVSKDGVNVGIDELAGLHQRSPLLAITLAVGVFALAGIPPFVGFMGKLTLLSAALSKGYLALVIIAVVNTAIAAYYYLSVVRESWFREAGNLAPIRLDWATRLSCILLIIGIVAMGVIPGKLLDTLSTSVAKATVPNPALVLPQLAGASAPTQK
jgi:NADH-quinone oxidoreductase subunit N